MILSDKYQRGWGVRNTSSSLLTLLIWFLRGLIYRLFWRSSKGLVLIGPSVKIISGHKLKVGNNFIVEKGAEINCISTEGLQLGNKVTIGSYAMIRPSNIYGGSMGSGLKIGDKSNIGPYCYIGCSGYIEIGNNVMMAPRVSLYAENHNFDSIDVPMKDQGVATAPIIIEDDCWIAANCIILSGVRIGKGSVIAAGSVVTKDVAPYSVMGGNPAKKLKTRT
jgi:acetyltransferase-like isoleucine patch superfamily enzyme